MKPYPELTSGGMGLAKSRSYRTIKPLNQFQEASSRCGSFILGPNCGGLGRGSHDDVSNGPHASKRSLSAAQVFAKSIPLSLRLGSAG